MDADLSRLYSLLAHSNCSAIPAFIFVRPYRVTRRWDESGTIHVLGSRATLPKWPSSLFRLNREGEQIEPAWSTIHAAKHLGLDESDIPAWAGPPVTSVSIHARCMIPELSDDLAISTQNCWLMLSLSDVAKAEVRKASSPGTYLDVLWELTKLVACSMPDPYAETLWTMLYAALRPIFEHDVIPFLSTLGESEFSKEGFFDSTSLHEIFRCLATFSLAEGYSLNRGLPFSATTFSKLETWYGLDRGIARDATLAINFKYWLCLRVAKETADDRDWDKAYELYGPPFALDWMMPTYGKLATVGVYRTISNSKLRSAVLAISNDILGKRNIVVSALDVIMHELTCGGDEPDDGPLPSLMQDSMPLVTPVPSNVRTKLLQALTLKTELRLALAFALANDGFHLRASGLLEASLKEFREKGLASSIDFGIASAELVKCLNAMGREDRGISIALEVLLLQAKSAIDAKRFDVLCLKIALSDSYIGSADYSKAEKVLRQTLKTIPLKGFEQIRVVTALRLSKVLRRRGKAQNWESVENSPIRLAIQDINLASKEAQAECFDEFASTIIQLESSGERIQPKILEELSDRLAFQVPLKNVPERDQRLKSLQSLIRETQTISSPTSDNTVIPKSDDKQQSEVQESEGMLEASEGVKHSPSNSKEQSIDRSTSVITYPDNAKNNTEAPLLSRTSTISTRPELAQLSRSYREDQGLGASVTVEERRPTDSPREARYPQWVRPGKRADKGKDDVIFPSHSSHQASKLRPGFFLTSLEEPGASFLAPEKPWQISESVVGPIKRDWETGRNTNLFKVHFAAREELVLQMSNWTEYFNLVIHDAITESWIIPKLLNDETVFMIIGVKIYTDSEIQAQEETTLNFQLRIPLAGAGVETNRISGFENASMIPGSSVGSVRAVRVDFPRSGIFSRRNTNAMPVLGPTISHTYFGPMS